MKLRVDKDCFIVFFWKFPLLAILINVSICRKQLFIHLFIDFNRRRRYNRRWFIQVRVEFHFEKFGGTILVI